MSRRDAVAPCGRCHRLMPLGRLVESVCRECRRVRDNATDSRRAELRRRYGSGRTMTSGAELVEPVAARLAQLDSDEDAR